MFPTSLFRKKYYLETSIKKRIQICIGFSVSIALFLLIFRPFSMALGHRLSMWQVALGAGLICFCVMFVISVGLFYSFPKIFQKERWTVGKEITLAMLNISVIAFCNILFASWAGFMKFSFLGLLEFEFYTLSIAIVPIIISIYIKKYLEIEKINQQNSLYQQKKTSNSFISTDPNTESASPKKVEEIEKIEKVEKDIIYPTPSVAFSPTFLLSPPQNQRNEPSQMGEKEAKKTEKVQLVTNDSHQKKQLSVVCIPTENKEENFKIESKHLIYIQAADNYLEIIYLENNVLSKKLIRKTLKSIAELIEEDFPQFFRCHKSYLINLHQVKHISGNAQGYKLHLKYGSELIPVSRKNNSIIKQKIEIFTKKHD